MPEAWGLNLAALDQDNQRQEGGHSSSSGSVSSLGAASSNEGGKHKCVTWSSCDNGVMTIILFAGGCVRHNPVCDKGGKYKHMHV